MAMLGAERFGVLAIYRRFGYISIRVEKQSVATPSAIDSADPAQHRRFTRPKKSGDESHALPHCVRPSGSLRLAIFAALRFQNAPRPASLLGLINETVSPYDANLSEPDTL